jgi:hypothetical protein
MLISELIAEFKSEIKNLGSQILEEEAKIQLISQEQKNQFFLQAVFEDSLTKAVAALNAGADVNTKLTQQQFNDWFLDAVVEVLPHFGPKRSNLKGDPKIVQSIFQQYPNDDKRSKHIYSIKPEMNALQIIVLSTFVKDRIRGCKVVRSWKVAYLLLEQGIMIEPHDTRRLYKPHLNSKLNWLLQEALNYYTSDELDPKQLIPAIFNKQKERYTNELINYINKQKADKDFSLFNSISVRFFGACSRDENIAAATALLSKIQGEDVNLKNHTQALNQGELGDIYNGTSAPIKTEPLKAESLLLN